MPLPLQLHVGSGYRDNNNNSFLTHNHHTWHFEDLPPSSGTSTIPYPHTYRMAEAGCHNLFQWLVVCAPLALALGTDDRLQKIWQISPWTQNWAKIKVRVCGHNTAHDTTTVISNTLPIFNNYFIVRTVTQICKWILNKIQSILECGQTNNKVFYSCWSPAWGAWISQYMPKSTSNAMIKLSVRVRGSPCTEYYG